MRYVNVGAVVMGATMVFGWLGPAAAATITCEASIADNVSVATGCERSLTEDQDFLNTDPLTVNGEEFFGTSNWVFQGKLNTTFDGFAQSDAQEGGGDSGSFDLTSLFNSPNDLMLVFKSGNNTTLVGYTISALIGTWTTPFECPPFTSNQGACNGFPKSVSHISVYEKPGASVIPLPAPALLLLGGLGALGLAKTRKRAA